MSFGVAPDVAQKLADDLIAKVDAFLNSTVGGFMKNVIAASMLKHDDDKE